MNQFSSVSSLSVTVGVLSFRAQLLLLNVMSFKFIYTVTNDGIFSSLITHSPRDIKVDPKSWYCGWKGNKNERAMSVGYTDSLSLGCKALMRVLY